MYTLWHNRFTTVPTIREPGFACGQSREHLTWQIGLAFGITTGFSGSLTQDQTKYILEKKTTRRIHTVISSHTA